MELVARELHSWEELEAQFRRELQEAERRAANPVLDESTLTAALGQKTAQLLRKAHEEAARLVAEAEQRSAAMLRETQERVTEATVQAEASGAERVAEAELVAATVHQQAEADAEQILESARRDGEAVVARARDHGRQMVEEAQGARKRVLNDMTQRRRQVHVQIEQLRAARDQLAAAVMAVRDKFDQITSELSGADDDARQAAAAAGQRMAPEGPDQALELGEPPDFLMAETLSTDEELVEEPSGEEGDTESEQLAAGSEPAEASGAPPVVETEARPAEQPDGGGQRSEPAQGADDAGASPASKEGEGEAAEAVETEDAGGEPPSGAASAPEGPSSIDDRSLEELFARIRASQDPSAREGQKQPTATAKAHQAEVDVAVLEEEEERLDQEAQVETVPAEHGGDKALLSGRDELLAPVQSKLTRRLKRTLQDEQNRLLDELRGRSGKWSDDLLPTEADHHHEVMEATVGLLAEAADAGRGFARSLRGDTAEGMGRSPANDVRPVADDLASTVVALLRRRLPGGREGPSPDDVDDAAEAVGAAFRDWRGSRVERLVGDYTLQAFSLGILGAAGSGADVRWVVGGDGSPCADCEDNSLAGTVPAGEDFPTGHPCPPAHAGCRCLLVPSA